MDPKNANMLPEAGVIDIEVEFDALIGQGDTTTLDVKNSLRAKGLWVNQAEVSSAIWDFVQAHPNCDFRYENGHRVYFLASAGYNAPMYDPATVAFNQGKSKPKVKKTAPTGNWQVYAPGGNLVLLPSEDYQNMTRNKARYTYSKDYQVPYVKTIAKKMP